MFGMHWSIWRTLRAIAVLILVTSAVMSSSTSTRADAVANVASRSTSTDVDAATYWNNIAVENLGVPGRRPGPIAFLDLAIVQAAVHDAVQAIDRRYEPYQLMLLRGASGSREAAAAKAAHDVLVNILPTQAITLEMTFDKYLTDHNLAEDDPGVSIGALAAASILTLRANDGRIPNPPPPPFIGGTDPGEWRPTPSDPLLGPPPPFAPMATPWLGAVPPFTLRSGDQFRADPPPPLSSKQYAKDYNEVKDLGARSNSKRTPKQDQLAYFYAGNNFILWNRVLRDVAAEHTDNIGDNARLLALGTLAIA
ncbi:MAG TPA: hypothetical protein VFO07_09395, partial [Roseiflexaceae bacterium]|nr:hypothetical protein [Roseiflexaceae bacterium]